MRQLEILFSKTKWRKAWLLVREFRKNTHYSLSANRANIYRSLFPTQAPDSVDLNQSVRDANSGFSLDGSSQSWVFSTHVSVPENIVSNATNDYIQDISSDNAGISVTHEYQSEIIPNATLTTNGVTHVSVYDEQDVCRPEYSYVKYRRDKRKVAHSHRKIAIDQYIPGLTMNLFGNVENASGNYGHWMVDGIAMLFLGLRNHSIDDIDAFLVPELKYDFQLDSLLRLGIPKTKIIEIPALSCFRFESLLCTTAPRGFSSSIVPSWIIDEFRRHISIGENSDSAKRIYISRKDAGSRKFVNEDEIISFLQSYGFESVELSKYDFDEKIALFSGAEIIVGLTGAGLTNSFFANKGATLIELFPASYVTYFYASIAVYLELDYRPLIFENYSTLSRINKYYGNLSLEVSHLEKVFTDMNLSPNEW